MVVEIQTFDGLALQRWVLLADQQEMVEEDSTTASSGWLDWSGEEDTISGYPVLVNPLNLALAPLYLTDEEARDMDEFLEHPRAFPTVPIHRIPRGDRSRLRRRTS